MKLLSFEIKFSNPQGVYCSGEAVTGMVNLSLAKPMKMNSLKLLFFGECQTSWTEKRGQSNTTYKSKESYLQHTIKLFPQSDGTESVEHPAGNHSYPFSLTLLPSLPSSFEGQKGYVRYYVQGTIDRPWKFDSHVKRIFTVIHHYDLNQVPSAVMPQSGQDRREVQSCCCDAGHVEVSLSIDKTGYVPGEPVLYDIQIDNQSDKPVEAVEFSLQQIATYQGVSRNLMSSGRPHFKQKMNAFSLYADRALKLNPHKNCSINRATIVPSLPPSNLDGCSIINIEYRFDLDVYFGMKCYISKPAIIGTIPLHEPSFPLAAVVPSAPELPEVGPEGLHIELPPITGQPGNLQPPSYEESLAPPPSYSESVFGRTSIQNNDDHTDGDTSWAPAYPYYDCTLRWNQTHRGQPTPDVARLGQSQDNDDDDE